MNNVVAADPAVTISSPRVGRAALLLKRQRGSKPSRLLTSRRDRVILVLAVCPALAWLAFAQGYPLGYSLWLSFQNWSLSVSPTSQGFAGLANFREVLTDPVFRHSIIMTVLVMATVPLEMGIGLALAYYAAGESRLLRVARTTLLLPMVIAPIAVGAVWRLMLTPNSGLLDRLSVGSGSLSPTGWVGRTWPWWRSWP